MRKIVVAGLSTVAFCATLGVGTATAAPVSGEPTGGKPGCVSSWVMEGTLVDTAFVENRSCKTTKKVRIVWAFGRDSVCFELKPGQRASEKVPSKPRRFEGHKPC